MKKGRPSAVSPLTFVSTIVRLAIDEASERRSSAQCIETSERVQRHNPLGFDTSLRSYSAGASLLLNPIGDTR